MLHPYRQSPKPVVAAQARSVHERISVLPRAAGFPLALVFALSLSATALMAYQLQNIQREAAPALHDALHLGETMSVLGRALRGADLDRADTLADQFHRVAAAEGRSEAKRTEMRRYDAGFTDYYVSARRAAAGLSMSDDADGNSARTATFASAVVRERLARGVETASGLVEGAALSAMKLRMIVSGLLAAFAGAALLMLAPQRRASTRREIEVPIERGVDRADSSEDMNGGLQEAVLRLAERRKAVARAAEQVAARNRQQVELLSRTADKPTLKVVKNSPREHRKSEYDCAAPGRRAAVGA